MDNNFLEGSNNFSNSSAAGTTLAQSMGVTSNATQVTDDELLRAYIGDNYEKLTTKPFNFAGFFLKSFYMFYRKMFLYGILVFIVGLIASTIGGLIGSILVSALLGLFVNKLYVYNAKQKIAKIKTQNPQKTGMELKELCKAKGGVSAGGVFMGFLAEFGIVVLTIVILLMLGLGTIFTGLLSFFKMGSEVTEGVNNPDIIINGALIQDEEKDDDNKDENVINGEKQLLEDAKLGGSMCMFTDCTFNIGKDEYICNGDKSEVLRLFKDYQEYIKLDIYYTQSGEERTIVDFKAVIKSTNEDVSKVKNENELRSKLGMFTEGSHTEILTLKDIGLVGAGYANGKNYKYIEYVFTDSKNNEYEMEYRYETNEESLKLKEGKKYTVTFEVEDSVFGYEYIIKKVK